MARVNSVFGLVSVIIVSAANVATTRAQSDEVPRRLRERISRTLFDEGFPWPAAGSESENKITASDGATGDNFGCSVAIRGNTLIVGAYDTTSGDVREAGAVYVYQRDKGGLHNWGEVTKISASEGAILDLFGFSVAISSVAAIVDPPVPSTPTPSTSPARRTPTPGSPRRRR